jgi:protoporphyrinogen/coproporphyrinogen III oxidase
MSRPRYAVVGGGWSGIAAAHYLTLAGAEVELFEAAPSLGGRSRPARLGDRQIVFGGKNIGRRYRRFRAFVEHLGGSAYEEFGISSSRIKDDRIAGIDGNRPLRSALGYLREVGGRDALRFGLMCARVRRDEENRFLGSPYFRRLADSRGEPRLDQVFSPGLLAAAIRPMTLRMNGAEPDEAYLGNFGSNLGMLLDHYDQLADGNRELISRFQAACEVRPRTRVEALTVAGGRVSGIEVLAPNGQPRERRFDAVVLATPAHESARLLRPHRPCAAALLAGVRYHPAAVLVAEYGSEVFPRGARALMPPAPEALTNAGAYGISDLNLVRYTLSGRAARQLLAQRPGDEDLLAYAERTLSRWLPVKGSDRRQFACQRWENAYCAYLPDHAGFLRCLGEETARLPGLALTGDYFRGGSIEACFRAAEECAAALGGES